MQVLRNDHLDADEVSEVRDLTRAASEADGVYPLSEHVMLHLRHGGDLSATHLLVRGDDQLLGYAHVDTTDHVEGPSAEVVVHPAHRRRGLGRALVTEAMAIADERKAESDIADERADAHGPGGLRLWAHGDHPSATALAWSLGFERWRVLWQMRRSLYAPVPTPELPPGVALRPFRPGVDDEAWVALNADAFEGHPEQAHWTLHDLHVRLRESWFDPTGFLLAEQVSDGELLGFHWTKVHGQAHEHPHPVSDGQLPHAHDPIGEVYVLGVASRARHTGLGRALTLAGLRYLRNRGLDQAMLYVDEASTEAVSLYQGLDFARWSTDVCFRRRF